MKKLRLVLLLSLFFVYGVKAQSKWNTNTLDTVVVVAQKTTKHFKIPDNPVGERKGQPVRIERDVRYIDSSLKR